MMSTPSINITIRYYEIWRHSKKKSYIITGVGGGGGVGVIIIKPNCHRKKVAKNTSHDITLKRREQISPNSLYRFEDIFR